MIDNRSDNIRAVYSFPGATEIIFEVVVELEGLAALQAQGAVKSPAVSQLLRAAPHPRQAVAENPGKAMWYVEVRRPIFQRRPRAVVGLCGIGFEVLTVAGGIK